MIGTHGEDARHLRVEQAGHAAKHDQACERRHPQQSQFVAGCEHFLVDKGRKTRLYCAHFRVAQLDVDQQKCNATSFETL